MDEQLRAIRRRRRKERRVLRRVWNVAPLVLVALAYALSAGVVKLMEVAPGPPTEEAPAPSAQTAVASAPPSRLLSMPDTRPELPAMLSTSILDHEVSGPPEQNRSAPMPAAPQADLLALQAHAAHEEPESVPEPGTALLFGTGLLCVASAERRRRSSGGDSRAAFARYSSTPSSSTSKVSTAPGGITPGTPASP